MQQKKKYKVRGHESFCIREGWLSKGLHAVRENPKVFSKSQGADVLGVGTNMVKSIRYWLKASALAVEQTGKGMQLTEFGQLVYQYDPYMEDIFTLWCIHLNIVKQAELATSWYLFFSDFMLEEFKREDVEEFLRMELEKYTMQEEINARAVKEDCNVLLQMYARDPKKEVDPEDKINSPLEKLGIIRKNGQVYRRVQPDLERFPEEVVCYLLQGIWKDTTALNIDNFYHGPLGVYKTLGLSMSAYQDCLAILERKEYIDINRTAGLDMIYKKQELTREEIVRRYYEAR